MKKLTTLISTSALLCAGAEAALVAHYDFENASDLGLDASSGTAYNLDQKFGIYSQSTTGAPIGSGALNLSSSDAYFRDSGGFDDPLASFTVAMHFNLADANTGVPGDNTTRRTLISQRTGAQGGFLFFITENNQLQAYTYAPGKYNGNGTLVTLNDSHDGQWLHVAMSYDNASQTVKTYFNGTLSNTVDYSSDATNPGYARAPIQTLNIGRDLGFINNGQVDDIGIWDVALSDAEISTVYSAGVAAVPEPTGASLLGLGALAVLNRRRRA